MARLLNLAILIICSVPVLTSCSRQQCDGINCFNGGSCENGKCHCPTGFTGSGCLQMDTTEIDFYNNTFTPVNIWFGNTSNVIPVGGYVAYRGAYSSYAAGTASTSGTNSAGGQLGLNISWPLFDSFALAKKVVYINVPPQYFFLKITNKSAYTINEVFVNYGLDSPTLDYVTIPGSGSTYNMGYYYAFSNTNLYLESSSNTWSYNLNLPFTQNQSYTYIAN